MSYATYEFPLNEKMRNYLKIEALIKQVKQHAEAQTDNHYLAFFHAFFALLDALERADLRTDLLRDLDQYSKNLAQWMQHPQVDKLLVQGMLDKNHELHQALKQSTKLVVNVQDERLLHAIRQRFAIMGGVTFHDLPNLYFWLRQADSEKQRDCAQWVAQFDFIDTALAYSMKMIRERVSPKSVNAERGFYKGDPITDASMVRVTCSNELKCYPTVSGNKHRFSIKFVAEQDTSPSMGLSFDVPFQIAVC